MLLLREIKTLDSNYHYPYSILGEESLYKGGKNMETTDVIQMMVLADLFKLLGDKTRLTIMALLQVQSLCVRDLVEILQASQPSVSQHLAKLKGQGLVKEERRGAWVFYSLNNDAAPVMKLILEHLPDVKPLVEKQQRVTLSS